MNKNTERQNQALGCAILVVIAMIVYVLTTVSSDKPGGGATARVTKTPDIRDTDAFTQCKDHVRDRLKAPGSAKFPFYEYKAYELGNYTWRIISYVDAQNSFGALLRADWTCEIQYRNGLWYLQSMVVSER